MKRRGLVVNQRLESDLSLYPIGAVAALTGLTTNTIRAWEKRYQAVTPARSPAGGRRYSDADVERLQLLRRLTQAGCSIGAVATLPTDELRGRLGQFGLPSPAGVAGGASTRVAVVHPSLAARLEQHPEARWEVVLRAASVAELEAAAAPEERDVDVLLVDLEALGPDAESALERCIELTGAEQAIVLYHFAARRRLSSLAASGARLVREPLPVAELHRLLEPHVASRAERTARGSTAPAPAPRDEPRFDEQKLARLREVVTRLDCECPNHLATLLCSLTAFERYSRRCEARDPVDREVHQTLRLGTQRARAIMEDLLALVCAHDGIEL